MKLEKDEIIKILNKRLNFNKRFLCIGVVFTILTFFTKSYFYCVYFLVFTVAILFNIKRIKDDIVSSEKEEFDEFEGTVVDFFPENKKEKKWVLFLLTQNQGKVEEFVFEEKPKVNEKDKVKVVCTKKLKTPVKVL